MAIVGLQIQLSHHVPQAHHVQPVLLCQRSAQGGITRLAVQPVVPRVVAENTAHQVQLWNQHALQDSGD